MADRSTHVLFVAPRGPQGPIWRILKDADFPVVCVNSASAALRAVEATRPDVIVADPKAVSPSDRDMLVSFAALHHVPLVFGRADREALVAEVEHTLGRQEPAKEETQTLVAGLLQIDLASRVAKLGDSPLDLTAREFDLLCHFARHPGWVYSREELLEQVWGYDYGDPQIVTVHIANIRRKVKEVASDYQLIETVQRIGYRLTAPPATEPAPGAARPLSGLLNRKLRSTRVMFSMVLAGVVIVAGLGVGLWLGLRGGDGTVSVDDVVGMADSSNQFFVTWGPQVVTEKDERGNVFWQASWWVHAKLGENPSGRWGSEVMDWSVTLPPPTAPPLGRNETADLVYVGFQRVRGASVATAIFRFDTKDWDHPGSPFEPFPPFVYHTFILTDNPGSQLDHVEGYARSAGPPDPEGPWGMKFMDIDCSGVEIVGFQALPDDVND